MSVACTLQLPSHVLSWYSDYVKQINIPSDINLVISYESRGKMKVHFMVSISGSKEKLFSHPLRIFHSILVTE